jgi:hypothetical protein
VAKFVQMSMLLKKIFKCKMLTFAENHWIQASQKK